MSKPRNTSPVPVDDLKEAKHFHGRKRILRKLEERMGQITRGASGTTILIQAEAGAGKTGLLGAVRRRAGSRGWQVAVLRPQALWDANILRSALGQSEAESLGPNPTVTSTIDVLKEQPHPLLLLLDEAEALHEILPEQSHEFKTASRCLRAIHNGQLERPVLLIAAGRARSRAAFARLHVTKFSSGCYLELDPLTDAACRAVIQDWLQREGGAEGDPGTWVDAIAPETYAWPRHIQSYVEPAVAWLRQHGGVMTPEGLTTVLAAGEENRKRFFEGLMQRIPEKDAHCIAKAFKDSDRASESNILDALRQGYDREGAQEAYFHALDEGLLKETAPRYVIPIKSFHDWFLDNYYYPNVDQTTEHGSGEVEQ